MQEKLLTVIFASAPENDAESARDGRWLATTPGSTAPQCHPEKKKAVLPNPTINLPRAFSPVHTRPFLSSSFPLLSSLSCIIMFKLARSRPIAAAFRAATVRSSRCRAIGPCPVTVDIVLIDHLGVVRSDSPGPAAEAQPLHSRVPVRPSPQVGMSTAPRTLSHAGGSCFLWAKPGR